MYDRHRSLFFAPKLPEIYAKVYAYENMVFNPQLIAKNTDITGLQTMEKDNSSMKQNKEQGEKIFYKIVEEPGRPKVILIEPAMVPYIFHFSESTLSTCKLNPQLAEIAPLALEVFEVLRARIIPKRKSSRTGRAPTRMKYEEKVKFIMRSVQYKIANIQGRAPQKLVKFNTEQQRQFFKRQDVQTHFKTQIPVIIADKKKSNDVKIRQFEEMIVGVLREAQKDLKFARKSFEDNIKQRQLPWSIEMFKDIKVFANHVYEQFVPKINQEKPEKPYETQKEQVIQPVNDKANIASQNQLTVKGQ